MRRRDKLENITYLLIVAGIVSTYMSGRVSPLIVSIAVFICLINFLLDTRKTAFFRRKRRRAKRTGKKMLLLKNLFIALLLIFLLIDTLFISLSLLTSAIRLLLFAQVLKLFDLKDTRDLLQMKIIVFFQVLSSAATTTNLSLLPLFGIYFVLSIWWIMLFHFREEAKTAREKAGYRIRPSEVRRLATPMFFITTGILSLVSFFLSLIFFFIIPRVGVGLFTHEDTTQIRVSGFSEEVDFGDIGSVKLDPTIVMRVETAGLSSPPKKPFYWKGKVFDYFDGFRWQNTYKKKKSTAGRNPSLYLSNAQREYLIKQNILLESLDARILFAVPIVYNVEGLDSSVRIDEDGTISLSAPPLKRIDYTAYSYPEGLTDKFYPLNTIKGRPISPVSITDKRYLQIPYGMNRVAKLAEDITKGLERPEDKAIKIEKYLKQKFTYNLNAIWDVKRPLNSFLFNVKEGYCEQFATAMAILLRSVGVPARLVTGFLEGEWNRYGGYFLVRQRDAHSWVEAFLPGKGWVTFDPTPSIETPLTGTDIFATAALFIDYIKLKWNRYIIRYSFEDQKMLVTKVRDKTLNLKNLSREFLSMFKNALLSIQSGSLVFRIFIIIAVVLIVLSVFTIVKYFERIAGFKRAASGRKILSNEKRKAVRAYLSMLYLLKKKGFVKERHITPWEFMRTIDRLPPNEIAAVKFITGSYYRIRFGLLPYPQRKLKEMEEALKNLKS